MTELEIDEGLIAFHEVFTEILDDFIIEAVEMAEEEFDVEQSEAFSMMAARMTFIVIRGAIQGGATKETLMETIEQIYDVTKLALTQSEGGLQ